MADEVVVTEPWPARFTELLDVEELDRDLYRARNDDNPARPTVYGGQVAAQALMAAGRTVPAGRHPHSLHGYFLRRGSCDRPILLRVERDRDGGSFSARHVDALQDGQVIFDMTASFHVDEPSPEVVPTMPADLVPPEAMEPSWFSQFFHLLELRTFPTGNPDGQKIGMASRMWVRVRETLPDDRLLHACALTYVSDLGNGFATTRVPGLAQGGPSLDHAIWFHGSARGDEWVLLDLVPVKAGWTRGLYTGSIYTREGALAAALIQEILLRGQI